jgi:hypothetical protein
MGINNSGLTGSPGQQLEQIQEKLREAASLLDNGAMEYSRLYRSRFNLLEGVARIFLQAESAGQTSIAQELQRLLALEGVRRFTPEVGSTVQRDRCTVSKLKSGVIPPGQVALVLSPGFIAEDGEVVLPAEVMENERHSKGIPEVPEKTKPVRPTKQPHQKHRIAVPPHPQTIPGITIVKDARERLGVLKCAMGVMEKDNQLVTERLQQTFQRYSLLSERLRQLAESSTEVVRSFAQSQPKEAGDLGEKMEKLNRVLNGR